MQIEIKLYGDLKKYAPADQTQFGVALATGATLEEVLEKFSIPKDRHVALVNGRRASGKRRLENGDILVLMPLISGG